MVTIQRIEIACSTVVEVSAANRKATQAARPRALATARLTLTLTLRSRWHSVVARSSSRALIYLLIRKTCTQPTTASVATSAAALHPVRLHIHLRGMFGGAVTM